VASVQRSVVLADSASTTAVTDTAPVPTTGTGKKKHPDGRPPSYPLPSYSPTNTEMVRLYDNVIHGMGEINTLSQGTAQDGEELKVAAARLILYKASRYSGV
jgi:hypothetical protein